MKKIVIAAAGMMVAAGAATAQYAPPPPPPTPMSSMPMPHGPGAYDPGAFWQGAPASPRERIQFLQDRVNRGLADGSLNRAEGARVNRELQSLRLWLRNMHWDNGGPLTPDQQARVQARLDQVSGQIRWLRHNGW